MRSMPARERNGAAMLSRLRRARIAFTVAALALLFAAACAEKPKLSRLSANAVILAFGDSLTYGTGAAQAESYPAQLAAIVGRTVARAGVPGETSAAGLARLAQALEEHRPQLLLLLHGGNDFLQRLPKERTAANVREMVRLARERGVEVVLIGTPEPGLTVTPPDFYARIARAFSIPYEGSVIGTVLRDPGLKSDPVHPNAKGYRLIAERVAALLRDCGAL
jgi:lysophospholipase L1-like esterase